MNNFMEIFSKIVREHIEDINNNNFVPVYSDSKNKIPAYELTRLFMIAGINSLQTLGWVPEDYARDLLTVTEAHINDDVVTYLLKNHNKYGIEMKPIDPQYWWQPDHPDYDLGWFDPVKFNKWS